MRKKARIALDPHKLGMALASLAATGVLLFSYLRQPQGVPGDGFKLFIGAGIAFVVSYAVTGIFVLWLRGVHQREQLKRTAERRARATKESAEAPQPPLDSGEST